VEAPTTLAVTPAHLRPVFEGRRVPGQTSVATTLSLLTHLFPICSMRTTPTAAGRPMTVERRSRLGKGEPDDAAVGCGRMRGSAAP
jgi:hypothetical protein